MADEQELAAFAARLAPLGPVRWKRMFGGAGYWLTDEMFACWAEGSFMLRADEVNAPAFAAKGISHWTPQMGKLRERPMRMPYYAIPDDVLADDDVLVQWARAAQEAATRAGARKGASKRAGNGTRNGARTAASKPG